MKLPHSVCEVVREHDVLESECIDSTYLNVYVPQLQRLGGVVWWRRSFGAGRRGGNFGCLPSDRPCRGLTTARAHAPPSRLEAEGRTDHGEAATHRYFWPLIAASEKFDARNFDALRFPHGSASGWALLIIQLRGR